jgi:formate hydrogenlyase subunit 3/multisubunit Na+/H+ antiporter MnhD subunit
MAALFLVLAAVLIELKPFPANGWALDVYETTQPGIAAVLSIGTSTAMLAGLYKLLPLFSQPMLTVLAGVGFLTFIGSNLVGLRQEHARRLLGYSSVAHVGLITGALALLEHLSAPTSTRALVAGGLFLNHFLAKGGLFWLLGLLKVERVAQIRGMLRRTGGAALVFGSLTVALAALPPFPGFWAKWQLVGELVGSGSYVWLVFLLAGSLFEAGYLFRLFGEGLRATEPQALAVEDEAAEAAAATDAGAARPRSGGGAFALTIPGAMAVLSLAAGLVGSWMLGFREVLVYLPLLLAAAVALLEWLPAKVKALAAIAALGAYGAVTASMVDGIALVFLAVIVGGSAVLLIATLRRSGTARGLFPLLVLLVLSMGALPVARSPLGFFLAFELMTLSSYLLLLRRPEAWRAARRYLLFSLGGAFVLITGLWMLSAAGTAFAPAAILGAAAGTPAGIGSGVAAAATPGLPAAGGALGLALIVVGFLIKVGAAGVHLWLPGAYAESEDEVSAVFSAVLSKVPVLGLILVGVLLAGGATAGGAGDASAGVAAQAGEAASAAVQWAAGAIPVALGWIGLLTALFGALLAVLQEDVKYLLAYSSMSQLGYIVAAVGLMTHLGWTTGLYLTVLHFLFKGLLFLAVAGVIMRTGTRMMYELGGLIKRMPVSFVTVLIGIIAVSGVPPLAGFGGKWMLYTALMEHGWHLQTALAFFASTIAFLYLFRLIYTVFLGQLKDSLRSVREAPAWILAPQLIFMLAIMTMSMFPTLLLEPLSGSVAPYFPATIEFSEYTVLSVLGYWNGNAVMWVTMGVFLIPLLWLMLVMRRPQPVGQFNIVYAGERPERPETTHFSHNFFAHYSRALGFLTRPGAVRFWEGVSEGVGSSGSALRRLYTGNGQTYALHILLFVAALYLIMGGLS